MDLNHYGRIFMKLDIPESYVANEITFDKETRLALDKLIVALLARPHKSAERTLAFRAMQTARHWLGEDLAILGAQHPYPNGSNPNNTVVDPPADVAKRPTVASDTQVLVENPELKIQSGQDGVWLHFKTRDRYSSINLSVYFCSERSMHDAVIVEWAKEYATRRSDVASRRTDVTCHCEVYQVCMQCNPEEYRKEVARRESDNRTDALAEQAVSEPR
jgi:hypothetical protein